MKLLFVEKEGRLSDAFKKNTNYEILNQENLNLLSMSEAEILIVDEKTVTHQELLEKKEYFSDFNEIFFVTQNQDLLPIFFINNIKPIVTQKPDVVLQTIEQYIFTDTLENKVYVFFGTDRKAGLTTITHAVAENLGAMINNKKVLLINLSDNANETLQDVHSFDTLKGFLKPNNLTVEEIERISTKVDSYYYIGATESLIPKKEYSIEEVSNLYRFLKTQSEYVVILDVGSNPNYPFYVVALDYFKNNFLVTKPEKTYQIVFEKIMKQLIREFYKFDYNHFLTIVNGSYDFDDLLQNHNVMAKINYSQIGLEAENKGIPLHKLDDYYNEEIQAISKYIAYKMGYKPLLEEKKKSWISKWKKKKVGEKV